MEVATVISACSLDAKFLPFLVEQARKFSKEIIISACHKRYDGTPEPDEFFPALRARYSGVARVAEYVWTKDKPAKYWHNLARWVGVEMTASPWLLFVDADEIMEGYCFKKWCDAAESWDLNTASFACFWYFRSPTFRATTIERCGLIMSRKVVSRSLFFTDDERYSYSKQPGYLHADFGMDRLPMFHHYSWVHNEADMLGKVRAWAHSGDKDWQKLVREEFKRQFVPGQHKDFVHGYNFVSVEPFISGGSLPC